MKIKDVDFETYLEMACERYAKFIDFFTGLRYIY